MRSPLLILFVFQFAIMCHRMTCPNDGKPTWWGCGYHVESVSGAHCSGGGGVAEGDVRALLGVGGCGRKRTSVAGWRGGRAYQKREGDT